MTFTRDDEPGKPSATLIDLAIRLVRRAPELNLDQVFARAAGQGEEFHGREMWPGEHYRLLAAVVDVLKPSHVVEIGTAEGLSSLALKAFLGPDGRLTTFDLVPWEAYPHTCLTGADLADGRLVQIVADLGDAAVFARHADRLRTAEIVFIDAAKDGRLEQVLLDHFATLRFEKPPLFILDDIRVWNMLAICRRIERPKLDLTSFGHWSGTGLIEWI